MKLIKTAIFLIALLTSAITITASERMNVLFIAVDDLRPELGCFDVNRAITPSIDRLAASGVLFENAYCQVPVCGASRSSLLSGLYPTPDRFINYYSRIDKDAPNAITLPGHFRNNGYDTHCIGKIFHDAADNESHAWSNSIFRLDWHRKDEGWTDDGWRNYVLDTNLKLENAGKSGNPYEAADVGDTGYNDGVLTTKAIEYLNKQENATKPFFLSLGYLKPHLPFNAPKHYWDLYDEEEIKLPPNYLAPEGVHREFLNLGFGELRNYNLIPKKGAVPVGLARKLIHGYLASVTYIDRQIGMVLDALEKAGLADNTIVILWGDHGYHLGDNEQWCKHSVMETAIRVPLIIHTPGKPGRSVTNMVELIDMYPTLCDLAGLPSPGHIQGTSLKPILNGKTVEEDFAYSRWQKTESIRMGNYHYMRTLDHSHEALFDLEINTIETHNFSDHPDYQSIKKELKSLLQQKIDKIITSL